MAREVRRASATFPIAKNYPFGDAQPRSRAHDGVRVGLRARGVERRNVMAQGVSGPPVALEVHVTGKRILATIVDAIVFSVFFWVMSLLFGTTTAGGGEA